MNMAERPEDLNLPNAVVGRIIKDAVSRVFSFCGFSFCLSFFLTSEPGIRPGNEDSRRKENHGK